MKKTSEQHVKVENLTKVYQLTNGLFFALKDVELTIYKGEFIGVIGKSGSGKSTLMNMISGIDQATSGTVQIGEDIISSLNENQLAKWRGQHIGVVFQFFQLMPTLTILENVLLPMSFSKSIPKASQNERAEALLKSVGIIEQANKFPSTLSGGQQQRAAIARALANDPSVIIADEPTGNLDSKNAKRIMDLFRQLANDGRTVIVVSHDQDIQTYCDRTIHIADGQILVDVQSEGGTFDEKR